MSSKYTLPPFPLLEPPPPTHNQPTPAPTQTPQPQTPQPQTPTTPLPSLLIRSPSDPLSLFRFFEAKENTIPPGPAFPSDVFAIVEAKNNDDSMIIPPQGFRLFRGTKKKQRVHEHPAFTMMGNPIFAARSKASSTVATIAFRKTSQWPRRPW